MDQTHVRILIATLTKLLAKSIQRLSTISKYLRNLMKNIGVRFAVGFKSPRLSIVSSSLTLVLQPEALVLAVR